MRSFVVFCAAVAVSANCFSAPILSPDFALLAAIRERMLVQLHRQPDYTCLETVERSHRDRGPFRLVDRLRLEVALVDGKEMFGWPGEKHFEDADVRAFVNSGVLSNGNFAMHARAIFEMNSATFAPGARDPQDRTVRYDFRVPVDRSVYQIRSSDHSAVVGYHGSFWADAKTLDLRRLEVVADRIPEAIGIARAVDRMDYARIKTASGEFLLPALSELTMTDADGRQNRNLVRFSACREFTGRSILTFNQSAAPLPAPVADVDLPSHLDLTLKLLDDVDTGRAAIGDPVRARLENDLKQKGRILFARGATVLGRITRLEQHDDYTVLGIEFSEIESAGARARLQATLEEVEGAEFFGPAHRRVSHPKPKPGEGIIPLGAGRLRLFRGVLMFWRT